MGEGPGSPGWVRAGVTEIPFRLTFQLFNTSGSLRLCLCRRRLSAIRHLHLNPRPAGGQHKSVGMSVHQQKKVLEAPHERRGEKERPAEPGGPPWPLDLPRTPGSERRKKPRARPGACQTRHLATATAAAAAFGRNARQIFIYGKTNDRLITARQKKTRTEICLDFLNIFLVP